MISTDAGGTDQQTPPSWRAEPDDPRRQRRSENGEGPEKAALQQLIHLRWWTAYQRVTFYTRDGVFSRFPPARTFPDLRSPQAHDDLRLPMVDKADASDSSASWPHKGFLLRRQDAMVRYCEKVSYTARRSAIWKFQGRRSLNRIMDFVDNDVVLVQCIRRAARCCFPARERA